MASAALALRPSIGREEECIVRSVRRAHPSTQANRQVCGQHTIAPGSGSEKPIWRTRAPRPCGETVRLGPAARWQTSPVTPAMPEELMLPGRTQNSAKHRCDTVWTNSGRHWVVLYARRYPNAFSLDRRLGDLRDAQTCHPMHVGSRLRPRPNIPGQSDPMRLLMQMVAPSACWLCRNLTCRWLSR